MSQTEVVMLQKYWISQRGIGGSERIIDRVSNALIDNNVSTAVLTCGEFAKGAEIPQNFNCTAPLFDGRRRPIHEIPSIPKITEYVCQNWREIDIIQIGWGYEHYPEQLIKILELPIPKIFTMLEIGHFDQITQNFSKKEEKEKFMELLRQRLDAIVAISQPLKNEAQNLGFDNVELIYGPIPDNFHPVSFEQKIINRQKLGLPQDRVIYLYTGRLVAEKGVDHIVKAWKRLNPKVRNNSALVLVGGYSSDDKDLRNKVSQLQSDFVDSVYLFGPVDDETKLGEIFSSADVFVYPTRHQEGLAMAPAEAMASALPLITTEYAALHTGMSDLVIPQRNSLIYSSEEGVEGLATLLDTFQNKQLRDEYSSQAIAHIKHLEMSPKAIADKYSNLYQRLLNKYDLPSSRG